MRPESSEPPLHSSQRCERVLDGSRRPHASPDDLHFAPVWRWARHLGAKRRRKNGALPVAGLANERWAMDFESDQLVDGGSIRVLTIVNAVSKRCPCELHRPRTHPAGKRQSRAERVCLDREFLQRRRQHSPQRFLIYRPR